MTSFRFFSNYIHLPPPFILVQIFKQLIEDEARAARFVTSATFERDDADENTLEEALLLKAREKLFVCLDRLRGDKNNVRARWLHNTRWLLSC